VKAPAVSGYDDLVLRGNTLYTPEGSSSGNLVLLDVLFDPDNLF
jgi:hypothetical protein